jgi:hypothetical protein
LYIPYSTLKAWVNFTEMQNTLRKDVISKSACDPTVSSLEEEKDIAIRLKDLAGRRFGCTSNQTRRAALVFGKKRYQSPLG